MNRLASESSPYLQQHAGNPVGWWPWCDDAFAEARRREVPVLISVGYSACHWCHVMAHESFEDAEVAEVLNAHFVPVKVDREERPDIDAVYMEALQLLTGGGGWPMTVLALPDGSPFWAGTYLPKANFLALLRRVSDAWPSAREAIAAEAARLAEGVRSGASLPGPGAALPADVTSADDSGGTALLGAAAEALLERVDPEWGGLGNAPKFPQPASLEVFAQQWSRNGDPRALHALRLTLDAMSSGGIYDHLAGGFARYSTDRRWLVPHFEKMLYDNALLVRAYTHAWQLTRSERYRQVVEETVAYLLRPPVRLAEGAWASAEDADSEGSEGRYYTWSLAEVQEVAGSAAAEWYGVSENGNWEGKNVLWRPGRGVLARPDEVERARQALLLRRESRVRPGLDTKVLTEWNAMAIAALATAGTAFGRAAWVDAASETAEFLLGNLRRPDGRWLRSWRAGPGQSRHLACSADYAWLTEAFTRLSEATGRRQWTAAACKVADDLLDLFWDTEDGAFFTYGEDAEELIARMKDIYDGAVPSANATAALALARLGELTGHGRYSEAARGVVGAMAPALARAPRHSPARCSRPPTCPRPGAKWWSPLQIPRL